MDEYNDDFEPEKLRKVSSEELKDILEKHKKWLESKEEGEFADLSYTDLSGADLSGTILSEADLKGANLQNSNLKGALLFYADLSEADLSEANLSISFLERAGISKALLFDANLSNAMLSEVDFREANLSGAVLVHADLREANLSGAVLSEADLRGATIMGSNLSKAILSGADLSDADLSDANFEGTNVSGVKYGRSIRFRGIQLAGCYGSPRFKRFAQDQDFIEELTDGKWWDKVFYYMWDIFADCGRTVWTWLAWSTLLAIYFGFVFFLMGPNAFHIKEPLPYSLSTMIYYSVVSFTTLGFGDITPKTSTAAWWIMAEVVLGYIMLGGLISILATKLARRS